MKKLTGHFVAFWGAVFLFPGLAFSTALTAPGGRGLVHLLLRVILRLIAPIMVSVGGALFVAGKKLNTLPAEELLKNDAKPVLYLRSFELDKQTDREAGRFAKYFAKFSSDINIQTQEEVLAKALKRVGPCVAVGDPRSEEFVLGFSRLKLGDNWMPVVNDLISKSALVVHCAGGTEGLLWELSQVAELVKPRSKLLLVVTPTITQEWWELADKLFDRVPRFTVSDEDRLAYIAVIYFDEAGKPQNELIYGVDKPPRVILEEALDPLLHQLKIRPRPEIIRWLSNPRHSVLLLVFISATLLWLLVIIPRMLH